VLARWQDCVDSGDLTSRKALRSADAGAAKARGRRAARRGPQRIAALSAALRESLESFVVSLADQAAEQVCASWLKTPAGTRLLAEAAAERAKSERVKRIFESAFGDAEAPVTTAPFSRSSPDLRARAARAIAAWQDQLASGPAGLVKTVAMLADEGGGAARSQAAALLGSASFGPAQARAALLDRVRLLLDEELLSFDAVIDSAGACDDVAAVRLYQAEYSLEAVR